VANAKGIRAGKAFVELGVSDKLTAGLRRAQKRLHAFGAGLRNIGTRITAIAGINKKGFEYLWVRYEDVEDTAAKALVKRPTAVYVEKVYLDGDLDLLGI
jgi:hypothetical protein